MDAGMAIFAGIVFLVIVVAVVVSAVTSVISGVAGSEEDEEDEKSADDRTFLFPYHRLVFFKLEQYTERFGNRFELKR